MFWLLQNVTILVFQPSSISVKISNVLVAAECDGLIFQPPSISVKISNVLVDAERDGFSIPTVVYKCQDF